MSRAIIGKIFQQVKYEMTEEAKLNKGLIMPTPKREIIQREKPMSKVKDSKTVSILKFLFIVPKNKKNTIPSAVFGLLFFALSGSITLYSLIFGELEIGGATRGLLFIYSLLGFYCTVTICCCIVDNCSSANDENIICDICGKKYLDSISPPNPFVAHETFIFFDDKTLCPKCHTVYLIEKRRILEDKYEKTRKEKMKEIIEKIETDY